MQVQFPDIETHATLSMSDDQFYEFCAENRHLRIERAANGEIVIMPPAGFETGYRNNDISAQLWNWSAADGRGVALDSNAAYRLPDGAILSPDASWLRKDRMAKFTKTEKERFLAICPDFVIELISPSDRRPKMRAKMQEWIDNGAQLGWLINPRRCTVTIYRPEHEPENRPDAAYVDGEGPVKGFRLNLQSIWQGV